MMFESKSTTRWSLRVFLLVACMLGWMPSAFAGGVCSPVTGVPKAFTYGTIAVSNTLAVGAVIPGTVQSFTITGNCPASVANIPIVACPSSQNPVTGTADVYSTGLTGVGMRIRNSSGIALVGSGQCGTTSSLGATAADGSFNVSGTVELVKTGPIAAGTITPTTTTANYNVGVLNTGYVLTSNALVLYIAGGTAVRPVTCSVTSATANQSIPLATVSPSSLPQAGAAFAKTPFSIGLVCESGVKVAVTFSSTSGSSGIGSVLASTGTATGVGVQLLDASLAPIALDSTLQLSAGTIGNDSYRFFGQYYRLGAAEVTPGTVRAAAIFTMSYQ